MNIRTLLEKLAIPLLILILFFILTTFAVYFTQQAHWHRVAGINIHRVLELLDLREENTLATWFSSQLFLITSIAFVVLGWSQSPQWIITPLSQWIFRLTALGACLLSADEVGSVHETAGKWFERALNQWFFDIAINDKGYFWIILFGPVLLLGLIAVVHALTQAITAIPATHKGQRQLAYWILLTALFSLPGVFLFELLEARMNLIEPQVTSIFTCFEEAFELIGMYCLFLCTLIVIRHYQL